MSDDPKLLELRELFRIAAVKITEEKNELIAWRLSMRKFYGGSKISKKTIKKLSEQNAEPIKINRIKRNER